jgi:electron transfer flavoprotein alpha subunit
MEAKTKDLWVFIETNTDGSAKNVGIELLSPGRNLADKQGGALCAVVIGSEVTAAVEDANTHGADKIYVMTARNSRISRLTPMRKSWLR